MRLQWVHGALLLACAACGPKTSAPAQRATAPASSQPTSTSSTAASGSPAVRPTVRPGYSCPPAATSNFTVIPQGVIIGAAEVQINKDGRVAVVRSTPTELQI